MDPALLTVGVVKENQQMSSTPDTKARKRQSSEESNRSTKDRKSDSLVKHKGKSGKNSPAKASKITTYNKLEQLDQKWSERFSRLEAMLLSMNFTQSEPVFQSVVVSPTKSPPAGAVDNNQPFFQPHNDQPTTNQQKLTSLPATFHQQPAHQPETGLVLTSGPTIRWKIDSSSI